MLLSCFDEHSIVVMVTAPPSDQELMATMMTRITLLEQKVQSQSKELTEKVNTRCIVLVQRTSRKDKQKVYSNRKIKVMKGEVLAQTA